MKEKSDHWTTLKLRTPVHQDTISEMASHREKIIATHIFQKELIYRMYKEHLRISKKKAENPIENRQIISTGISQKSPLIPTKIT